MIITKMAIPRRTVLRGLGTALALPLLDSMVPALTATAQTPARAPLRFGVTSVRKRVEARAWTPMFAPVRPAGGLLFRPLTTSTRSL